MLGEIDAIGVDEIQYSKGHDADIHRNEGFACSLQKRTFQQ